MQIKEFILKESSLLQALEVDKSPQDQGGVREQSRHESVQAN